MGKQNKQKSRRHQNPSTPFGARKGIEDVSMDVCDDSSATSFPSADNKPSTQTPLPPEEEKTTGAEGAEEVAEGANRHVHKRQAVEWRKMKTEVAQLKRQRQKLRKKNVSQREERKKLGKLIKTKIFGLRKKHDAELQSLGLSKSVHETLPEEQMEMD